MKKFKLSLLVATIFVFATIHSAHAKFLTGWWVNTDSGNTGILNTYAAEGNTLVLLCGWFCGTSQISTTKAYLDVAQSHGMKAIVGLTCSSGGTPSMSAADVTTTVNSLKSHPALYGWYIGDEPELVGNATANHTALATNPGYYKIIKAADSNHPILISFDRVAHDSAALAFYDVLDIAGAHAYYSLSYGTGNTEFTWYGGYEPERDPYDDWKAGLAMTKSRGKDFIVTAQGFGDNTTNPYRNPTVNELKYQVFTAVAVGVDKILFWMDEWGYKSSMKTLVPQMIGLIQSIGAEMNNGVTNDSSITVSQNLVSQDKLVFRHGTSGSSHVILAINIANRASKGGAPLSSVQFTLTASLRPSQVEVVGENRNIPVTNGIFTDNFDRFEVHLYRFLAGSDTVPPKPPVGLKVD